jgi:UDP-N-acetylmuramoyl-L-alanyl-D-glutamate--2,6-diaminopimelate ligase
VLAAVSVLLNHGIAFDDLLNLLPSLRPVKGRMEKLGGGTQPTVVVDYAHTPDALQQTLHALRKHTQGKLWCVFGCGGDRDQGKRPLMGKIAEELAEHVILTNDNPRHENPQIILQGILAGIHNPAAVQVIPERQAAIEYALQHAQANDIVLIAGKGHEDYQQIGDQRLNFSDQAVVKTCLESLHHD